MENSRVTRGIQGNSDTQFALSQSLWSSQCPVAWLVCALTWYPVPKSEAAAMATWEGWMLMGVSQPGGGSSPGERAADGALESGGSQVQEQGSLALEVTGSRCAPPPLRTPTTKWEERIIICTCQIGGCEDKPREAPLTTNTPQHWVIIQFLIFTP